MADKKKIYNFGEKPEEFYNGNKIPVWQSPKYLQAKEKAIEAIESQKYGLTEADFWILMNTIKNKTTMAYTSLIISHNGCLKINDALENGFKPSCVSCDKDGYRDSLVFSYVNDEQGIYEVGEVSLANCKNDYPYAMAYKRLFDRVVLKLSKLAYSGIMSDSESDEFKQNLDTKDDNPLAPTLGEEITPRERLLHKLIVLGINVQEYAKEHKINDNMPDEVYINLLKELEEKYDAK